MEQSNIIPCARCPPARNPGPCGPRRRRGRAAGMPCRNGTHRCGDRSCAPLNAEGNPTYCYQLSPAVCERHAVMKAFMLYACKISVDSLLGSQCKLGQRCRDFGGSGGRIANARTPGALVHQRPPTGPLSKNVAAPARHHSLTVVTPSYVAHLPLWKRLVASHYRLPMGAGACSFSQINFLTIVSDEATKAQFQAAAASLGLADARRVDGQSMAPPRIVTLQEVLSAAEAAPSLNSESEIRRFFRLSASSPMNKHWLQSIKKMYGCLYAGQGLCFVTDSESTVVPGGSICHAASVYVQHKSVLVSPWPHRVHTKPIHSAMIEASRQLLDRPADFGEFYGMESYHWFWRVADVRAFLNRIWKLHNSTLPLLAAKLARPSACEQHALEMKYQKIRTPVRMSRCPTLLVAEEAFYHFLFGSARHSEGPQHRFVDVYAAAAAAVGADQWAQMTARAAEEGGNAVLECALTHISPPNDRAASQRVASVFVEHGVTLMRCKPDDAPAGIDVCVSDPCLPVPARWKRTVSLTDEDRQAALNLTTQLTRRQT